MTLTLNRHVRTALLLLVAVALVVLVGACSASPSEKQKREQQATQSAQKDTLEKANLRKKLQLEEDPNRVGYVYLVTFGKPFGYYVVKGKISNSGSQVDPENLINCPYSCSAPVVIDGPQDDGTYGDGDPGIFFFTTDGTMVTTSLDYVYSSQPLPSALDVPKLG